MKFNVSFDPVQLISSFRQTVNLGLLSMTFKNHTTIENKSVFKMRHAVVQLQRGKPLTLSIVSKMIVAAPRPAANASRHGEACPKFMAAIKTPKKT